MAERITDIIMSAPMIRGLLREIEAPGSGKTQTRRLAYDKRGRPSKWLRLHRWRLAELEAGRQPEVRIWVRETCIEGVGVGGYTPDWVPIDVIYRADGKDTSAGPWRPSIHMPRRASRITLDLKESGLEQLQDISEEDATAEGLATVTKDGKLWKWGIPDRDGLPGNDDHGWHWQDWEKDPVRAYEKLWTSLHGAGAWAANPEVVPLTFRPILANVDSQLKESAHA